MKNKKDALSPAEKLKNKGEKSLVNLKPKSKRKSSMRLYKNIIDVVIKDPIIIARAREFASKVTGTTNYSDSNQVKKDKISNDHFISKIGEEAAKIVLEGLGKKVTGPDYNIYRGRQKSWAADLFIDEDLGIAVKTQTAESAAKYESSWMFQAIQDGRMDSILLNKEAWCIFVTCTSEGDAFKCRVQPPFQIKELKFDDPKLSYLRNKKVVVYEKFLPKVK